jgi:hypothetical protein
MTLSREIAERWATTLNGEFETRGLSLKANAQQVHKPVERVPTWIVRINRYKITPQPADMQEGDIHQPLYMESYLSIGTAQEAIAFQSGVKATAYVQNVEVTGTAGACRTAHSEDTVYVPVTAQELADARAKGQWWHNPADEHPDPDHLG